MYSYCDRAVGDLPEIDRLLLDAMRSWALARTLGRDARAAIDARQPLLDEVGALEALTRALDLLDTDQGTPLTLQRPCFPTVEEDEAILLGLCALLRQGRLRDADRGLALLAGAAAAAAIRVQFDKVMRRLNQALAPAQRRG